MYIMRQQIQYFLWLFLFLPLTPILYWQAKRVKKNLIRLPEADVLEGRTGKEGKPLSILVFGESSFAGVGVTVNLEGIAGHLAQRLQEITNRAIHWQVIARSGFNAQKATEILAPQVPAHQPIDAIFIGLGANEAFEVNAPLTFRKNLEKCIQKIRERQPNCPIFLSDVPPVGQFPALPYFLKKLMHGLIALHGDVVQDFPKCFPNLFYNNGRIRLKEWRQKVGSNLPIEDFFCEDGIHPSKLTYQIWAGELAKMTMKKRIKVNL
jgi:lysophospholipase L1-like esterase